MSLRNAGEEDGLELDKDGFYTWGGDAEPNSMSGEDDEIEIEVVDDTPEEDRVPPRDPKRASETDDFADESKDDEADEVLQANRAKRLRYEWHEERRAKEAAERQRDEAVRFAEHQRAEAEKLRRLVASGERVLVEEVRARTKADVEQAQAALRAAIEEGDANKIAAAHVALSRATYDVRQAESYRIQEQQEPERQPERQPSPQAQPRPQQQDPKLAAWMSRNPWFTRDQTLTERAMEIHNDLVNNRGVSPEGDEYYKKIDIEMRKSFPTFFREAVDLDEDTDRGKAGPARRKPSQVVAPVARTGSASPKKVKLTASQVQIAKRMGLTNKQYAMEVMNIERGQNNG